jgi:hypothetical protein
MSINRAVRLINLTSTLISHPQEELTAEDLTASVAVDSTVSAEASTGSATRILVSGSAAAINSSKDISRRHRSLQPRAKAAKPRSAVLCVCA